MTERARLLSAEADAAAVFERVVASIPEARRPEPTVTPDGWTPVAVLAHVAAWLRECARVLDEMAAGTWDPAAEPPETPESLAVINADQVARAAALTWSEAEAAVAAARVRARSSWQALPEVTPIAWSWFEESGPDHYAKHAHDLTAWLAGVPSDPEVGDLLQADTDAWVPFAFGLSTADPNRRDDEGWSVVDVAHHVAAWMDLGAAAIANGERWEEDDDADTDGFNAAALAASRSMAIEPALDAIAVARSRLRTELCALGRPGASAKEIYRACTTEHYEEHRAMLERLTGSV